jgi:O-acetyl-ADP-ribose deacetylase (regulator of RNase III)
MVPISMDVTLLRGSVYELPSNSRVEAIVYDGACDLRLWRGPGVDRDLGSRYGNDLQSALDVERGKLGVETVGMGQVVRVHPGRLHCDFLLWVGTREPEPGTERNAAPGAELLRECVLHALTFVAERNVKKLGFSAMGSGPGELEKAERLEVIVRAAHEYEKSCFSNGKPPVVEQVLVCEPLGSVVNDVQRRVSVLAKQLVPKEAGSGSGSSTGPVKTKAKAAKKKATRKPRKPVEPALSPEEVEKARRAAAPFSIRNVYVLGDWLLHKKFGVGRVELVGGDPWIMVLFEDGTERKMVHAR